MFFQFEFQTQKFQSPSNYLPMNLWKNKTSLQREPRIRLLRKPSNCRLYFVLEFHWSRERERERKCDPKLWSLLLFALWFHCSKEQISILELAKKNSLSPSPLSSWISVGIACFRVFFFRVFSSLPLLYSLWVKGLGFKLRVLRGGRGRGPFPKWRAVREAVASIRSLSLWKGPRTISGKQTLGEFLLLFFLFSKKKI